MGDLAHDSATCHIAALIVGTTVKGQGSRSVESARIKGFRLDADVPTFVIEVELTNVATKQRSVWEISLPSDCTDYSELIADPVHREAMAEVIKANVLEWIDLRGTGGQHPNIHARQLS
jgi:hypothetical protein